MRRVISFPVFLLLCIVIVISSKNQNADAKNAFNTTTTNTFSISSKNQNADTKNAFNTATTSTFSLCLSDEYPASDPYHSRIAAGTVAPALLPVVFCDCSIQGCVASIVLDEDSEKKSLPSESLKGIDVINLIKEEIEEMCPVVVCFADTFDLAAREGVVLAGGPFCSLPTGSRDSRLALADIATFGLPLPNGDLPESLASFASRGLRETVTLLGAHSIREIQCQFFNNRLYNFGRSNEPDPSLDLCFLNLLRSKSNCRNTSSEGSALAGSRFHPLYTGNRGSTIVYPEIAIFELPSPSADLSEDIAFFMSVVDLTEATAFLGQNAGANVNGGLKRKPAALEEGFWENNQRPLNKRRVNHPKMYLRDDEGRHFDLKIKARLYLCNSLAPNHAGADGFTFNLRANCLACGSQQILDVNINFRVEINTTCATCGSYYAIELLQLGRAFTEQDEIDDIWVPILSFRSWNLHRFFYHFPGQSWVVRGGLDIDEHAFVLGDANREGNPHYFLIIDVNSDYYGYRHELEGVTVFWVTRLRATFVRL